MGAGKKLRPILVLALCCGLFAAPLQAQNTAKTVRKRHVPVENALAPAVLEAEAAIEKQNYPLAEQLLTQATAKDSGDYRAWFNLAFVYTATQRRMEAIGAYRKSLAIKPNIFASNLNLGILLAGTGNLDEAAQYLRAATQLTPSSSAPGDESARAWISLGRVLEEKDPTQALEAFRKAIELTPKDTEPHLSAGQILEKQGDFAAAESEYRAALTLDPKSSDALAGLVNVYSRSQRFPEAVTTLRQYLILEPQNVSARLQLGRLLLQAGKPDEALAEYTAGLRSAPRDPALLREIAGIYTGNNQFSEAAERYRELIEISPNDAGSHHQLGIVLMRLRKFPEAESELLQAVKLEPQLAAAYGDLAITAAENKKYVLAIQALDFRAKQLPENPGTYFLRATAYDNLKAFPEAAANYHRFLEVSEGKFPDLEWKARHRLVAIEPKK